MAQWGWNMQSMYIFNDIWNILTSILANKMWIGVIKKQILILLHYRRKRTTNNDDSMQQDTEG
jgi:hypothetical protein